MGQNPSLALDAYQQRAAETDKSSAVGIQAARFLLLGLFGEIGSLLSELKKKQRDQSAYFAYKDSTLEEFGDALWYLSNISLLNRINLSEIASLAIEISGDSVAPSGTIRTFAELRPQARLFMGPTAGARIEQRLLTLGELTSNLIHVLTSDEDDEASIRNAFANVFNALMVAADDAEVDLEKAAEGNLEKIESRWPSKKIWPPLYDQSLDEDEKFPQKIAVVFSEKIVNGKRYVLQKCNGINIGDRLTDNALEQDDYRFHDVFHLAFAAILGWSPVLRALLKLKRKSNELVDEIQDGARASITEEGISNWVFAQGIRHNLFADAASLDFSVLRAIKDMVRGYEVEDRPYWMWEHAILEGFRVFRSLKNSRGGVVTANIEERTLTYSASLENAQ